MDVHHPPRHFLTLVSLFMGVAAFSAAASAEDAYLFTKLAGAYSAGYHDGPGPSARFVAPEGIAIAPDGSVVVADTGNHVIRRVAPDGTTTTCAGSAGQFGHSNDSGRVRFFSPQAVAVGSNNWIYVADSFNAMIRAILPDGRVIDIAGSSLRGDQNGTGSAARFRWPIAIAVDGNNVLYVADNEAATIRRISATGEVTTLAGTPGVSGYADGPGTSARFNGPMGIAVDSLGTVYVSENSNHVIRKITPDGVVSTVAGSPGRGGYQDGTGTEARFYCPQGIALTPSGSLIVADSGNMLIREITIDGVVTTIAGRPVYLGFPAGAGQSWDGVGSAASIVHPCGVAVDAAGVIYVSERGQNSIRRIAPDRMVTRLAGADSSGHRDGLGVDARFSGPTGIACDREGNAYVTDFMSYTIRKVSPAGEVSTFGGTAGRDGSVDGDRRDALFSGPMDIAVDAQGNVYVADSSYSCIRKISATGRVTTLAGPTGAMGWLEGSDDGTGAAARFRSPCGIAADESGNVFVADTRNHTIRRITPAGVVTTLAGLAGQSGTADGVGAAARFNEPNGIDVAPDGTLYVTDRGSHTVRKVTTAGIVTTVAGTPGVPGMMDGPAGQARFHALTDIVVAPSGNLFVSEFLNHAIREITVAGGVRTIAGQPPVYREGQLLLTYPGSSDGIGAAASFYSPRGLALDPAGNLLVLEGGNNGVRIGLRLGPPRIVSAPSSRTVMNGERVELSVKAAGVGPCTFQWFFRGVAVDGATAAVLTLEHIEAAQTGDYHVTATNQYGATTSPVATIRVLLPRRPGSTRAAAGTWVDLDGDGVMEPVWRANSTQELGSWTADGEYMRVGQDGAGYEVVGYGDFDGDERSEAVWRHRGTRALVTWPSGGGYQPLGTESDAWQMLGLGDFDGDGKTEFLWRHGVTADIATWTTAGAYVQLGNESTGWQVIGVGDVDGDGKQEPVWRHASTTEVGTWTMAGPYVRLGAESGGWDVIGFGDFDADGKTEGMWRDRGSLEVGTWTRAAAYVRLGNENTGWMVIGVGDYDGDGRTEPLWRQTSTGEVGTWTMAGAYVRLGTEAAGLRVVPQAPTITGGSLGSQWLRAGASATLSIAASANPTPILQWQVSNDGTAWADVVDGAEYSGAGTASLTITSASRALHGNQYRCVVRNGAGRATSAVATLNVSARACVANDLDGDAKTDVLWRYTPLQELGVWTATGFVHLGSEGSGWTVIGVGDFDADGKMELVWRYAGSGQLATWPSGGGYVPLGTESAWQVIRIGDFDGDGHSELLWRHSGTGQVVTWTQAGAYLELGAETDGWQVIGIADFDGDGRQEPAWRNTSMREVRTTTIAGATIRLGTEGEGWTVIAFGDVDGDGQAEPFWRHAATLENVTWTSAGGFVRLGTESIGGWHVIAVGDYDGDGKSEPLWQHETTHEIATWTMADAYFPLGAESDNWRLGCSSM